MTRKGKKHQISKIELDRMIQTQFNQLMEETELATDEETKIALVPQSVYGRAINGHAIFKEKKFPNMTIERIIDGVGLNTSCIRNYHDGLIAEYDITINKIFDKELEFLVTSSGKPLFGVDFLRHYKLDLKNEYKEILQGIILAGRMDTIEWRRKTLSTFNVKLNSRKLQKLNIGGGKEHPINLNLLNEAGITPKSLTTRAYSEKEILDLAQKGIIAKEEDEKSQKVENLFIRYQEGPGVCDDLALIGIGKMCGEGGFLTAFCTDAVDTYSKFMARSLIGGADEYCCEKLATRWKEKYNEELVTPEQCMKIIYFGAKNNEKQIEMSSSHRRFIEYEKKCGKKGNKGKISSLPTILHHLEFVKNGKFPKNIQLGFTRMRSEEFYEIARGRFRHF